MSGLDGASPPAVVVGAVATDEDGRLLVVRRRNPPGAGRWTVPGGRVEPGERLADAVAREVAEETGLEVEIGRVVGVFEILTDELHAVSIDHRVRPVGGTLRAGDDASDARWMSRSELRSVPVSDGLLEFLDDHGVDIAP